MTQKTKIIATLGPASQSSKVLEDMILAGANVFRFNLKHNNHEWHGELANRLKGIAKKLNKNIALLADLQGPELRIGIFPNNIEKLMLSEGEEVVLSDKEQLNTTWIPFPNISCIKNLEKGHSIFIDDGKIELSVVAIKQDKIITIVKQGGGLGSRKSVSIPQANVDVPTLMPKDKEDIAFAVKENFEFVALSFVRNATDIATLRALLKKLGGHQAIIAKIETLKSIENMDEIVEASDGIMVARGDLGVEVPIEKVPRIQKELILASRIHFKPVIVATQMLLSMVQNPTPSRAEVADIANSVFDKTDAIMLSEETAAGLHPVKVVNTMSKIARYNEIHEFTDDLVLKPTSFEEIVISASIKFARQTPIGEEEIKGYIIFTESGKSARVLSRFRPPLPIYVFSSHQSVVRKLALSYGVVANHMQLHKNPVNNIKSAINILKKNKLIDKGDKLISIFGNNVGVPEANNTISIVAA